MKERNTFKYRADGVRNLLARIRGAGIKSIVRVTRRVVSVTSAASTKAKAETMSSVTVTVLLKGSLSMDIPDMSPVVFEVENFDFATKESLETELNRIVRVRGSERKFIFCQKGGYIEVKGITARVYEKYNTDKLDQVSIRLFI